MSLYEHQWNKIILEYSSRRKKIVPGNDFAHFLQLLSNAMVTKLTFCPIALNLETKRCAWLTNLLCHAFFLLTYIVILHLLNKLLSPYFVLKITWAINPFLKWNLEENKKLARHSQGIPSLSFLRFYFERLSYASKVLMEHLKEYPAEHSVTKVSGLW